MFFALVSLAFVLAAINIVMAIACAFMRLQPNMKWWLLFNILVLIGLWWSGNL